MCGAVAAVAAGAMLDCGTHQMLDQISAATAPGDSAAPDFTFAYVAWTIALSSMLGSLFFGEVIKLPPCTLCWYQRICLFPLAVVLAVGIVRRDPGLVVYSLPFVVAGLGFAVYHNLLYWGVIPERLSPCTAALSCTTKQIEWLGFITIPLMSLAAFASILIALLVHRARSRTKVAT